MPARSSAAHRLAKAKLEALQAEIEKLQVLAAGHRSDFDRERERADRIMIELLRMTTEAMMAKQEAAHLRGQAEVRSWPLWRRMAG